MARSNAVANILWKNIGRVRDCLTVVYETEKTKQEGNNRLPSHVFANPDNTAICPIIALGLKLVSEETSGNQLYYLFSRNCRVFIFQMTFKSI